MTSRVCSFRDVQLNFLAREARPFRPCRAIDGDDAIGLPAFEGVALLDAAGDEIQRRERMAVGPAGTQGARGKGWVGLPA